MSKKFLFAGLFLSLLFLASCLGNPAPTKSPTSTPSQSSSPSLTPTSPATPKIEQSEFLKINFESSALAKNLKLNGKKPEIYLSREKGQILGEWDLNAEMIKKIPSASILKVWLVDNEKNKDGSSVSESDEKFGKFFPDDAKKEDFEKIPFAEAIGSFLKNEESKKFEIAFRGNNNLLPYDMVMITLETDSNQLEPNPRPGSLLWLGKIDPAGEKTLKNEIPAGIIVIMYDREIEQYKKEAVAEKLNLNPSLINLKIHKQGGRYWLSLKSKEKFILPPDTVMEAWLYDDNSLSDLNQKKGPSYGDAKLSEQLNKVPQLFSLGKMLKQSKDDAEETYYAAIVDTYLPGNSFDKLIITLESDGNKENYDPRPGTPLLTIDLN